jgi:AraC family transcriptional activator of pobA
MDRNKPVQSLFELYQQLHIPSPLQSSPENFSILNLKDVGFEFPYKSEPFRPNYFNFLFVKDGEGAYTIDDQHFIVEPASVYFTNPSNYRTFGWDRIGEIYLITFDEGFLKKYLGEAVFDDFPFLLTETLSPRKATPEFFQKLERVYLLINGEFHGNSPSKYKIISHLLSVLLFYIKEYFWEDYNPINEGNRKSQIVKSFKRHLDTHYRDLLTGRIDTVYRVQDYALAQNLHPGYLTTVIKTKTGKSIQNWIAEKTTTLAKSLLHNSDLSIKQIAYKLGFNEAAHFSNYFKKQTGITPRLYREQRQSASN